MSQQPSPEATPLRRRRALLLAFAVAWSAAVVGGALGFNAFHPERSLPLIARIARHESVHVVAHVFLYGTLAAACVALSRRAWVPLCVVAVVGLLQEAAQTSFFGKPMGAPEVFDLAVDLTAAAAVVLASRARERAADAAMETRLGR